MGPGIGQAVVFHISRNDRTAPPRLSTGRAKRGALLALQTPPTMPDLQGGQGGLGQAASNNLIAFETTIRTN